MGEAKNSFICLIKGRMSPLRGILQLFFSKNHHVMTEKLASSYPMRRAAQLVAHLYFRAEGAVKKSIENQSKSSIPPDQTNKAGFWANFERHLKNETEDFKRKKGSGH